MFHKILPFCWSTAVEPGDMVSCRGTFAYYASDFASRTLSTPMLQLSAKPILVIAVIDGDPSHLDIRGDVRTFVMLSRRGLLVTVQDFKHTTVYDD